MHLLDFIFPKYCVNCRKIGEYICPDCFVQISFDVEKICLVCNKPSIDGRTHPGCRNRYTPDGSAISISYKSVAKRLIIAFKYKPYISDLQHVLTDLFYEGIIQQELFIQMITKDSILVPMPLHPVKLRQRGYNQAEILAGKLGRRLGIPVLPMLKRVKKTETQTVLKREKRLENIAGAFALNNNIAIEHCNNDKVKNETENCSALSRMIATKQVLLVDDVITSGATMLEAANVLKRHGVKKVWGIALAHGK